MTGPQDQIELRRRLSEVVPGNTLVRCPKCQSFGEASGTIKFTCDKYGFYPVTAADHGVTKPQQDQIEQAKETTVSEAGKANVEFTPADAFGLLRSYSRHRDFVRLALTHVQQAVERRAIEHDASKMLDDEFAGFARINAVARTQKFGTPEYAASINAERDTVDLHFSRNRHHPERPKLIGEAAEVARGLPDDFTYWMARDGAAMNFIDVIEMVCDWWGARQGYADSRMSWVDSVEMNLKSKGKYLSDWQIALVRDVAAFLSAADPERAK